MHIYINILRGDTRTHSTFKINLNHFIKFNWPETKFIVPHFQRNILGSGARRVLECERLLLMYIIIITKICMNLILRHKCFNYCHVRKI